MINEIDITGLMCCEDLILISKQLSDYVDQGFTKLYWDGYDSVITIEKE